MRPCSWNRPPSRYTFGVSDSLGSWGNVEITAHDVESAKRLAQRDMAQLEASALRGSVRFKLIAIVDGGDGPVVRLASPPIQL